MSCITSAVVYTAFVSLYLKKAAQEISNVWKYEWMNEWMKKSPCLSFLGSFVATLQKCACCFTKKGLLGDAIS